MTREKFTLFAISQSEWHIPGAGIQAKTCKRRLEIFAGCKLVYRKLEGCLIFTTFSPAK